MAIELPAEVTQARQRAQSLLGAAGQMKANEPAVTDVLRQKVQDAYSQNQDIIKPLDEATQAYLQGPQVGREKYQDIFNPFTREKLVSQYRGNLALPMLSLSSILGNRMGRIEDVLGAGVRGYSAATDSLVNQAQLAQQNYQDLFDEFKTLEELNQSSAKLKQGSDSGGLDIDNLLKLLGFGKEDVVPGSQYQEPIMSSIFGRTDIQVEWPQGSGVIWTSDGMGGWE